MALKYAIKSDQNKRINLREDINEMVRWIEDISYVENSIIKIDRHYYQLGIRCFSMSKYEEKARRKPGFFFLYKINSAFN